MLLTINTTTTTGVFFLHHNNINSLLGSKRGRKYEILNDFFLHCNSTFITAKHESVVVVVVQSSYFLPAIMKMQVTDIFYDINNNLILLSQCVRSCELLKKIKISDFLIPFFFWWTWSGRKKNGGKHEYDICKHFLNPNWVEGLICD